MQKFVNLCRSPKILQVSTLCKCCNLFANIGLDTVENKLHKVWGSLRFPRENLHLSNAGKVIIVSTVRGGGKDERGLGFMNDKRRLNVLMTRARTNLWIVGNGDTLSNTRCWGKNPETGKHENPLEAFLNAAMSEKRYLNVPDPASTYFNRFIPSWCDRNPGHPQLHILQKFKDWVHFIMRI